MLLSTTTSNGLLNSKSIVVIHRVTSRKIGNYTEYTSIFFFFYINEFSFSISSVATRLVLAFYAGSVADVLYRAAGRVQIYRFLLLSEAESRFRRSFHRDLPLHLFPFTCITPHWHEK